MSTPFYSFAIPVLEKGERCKLMRVRTSCPVPVCTLDTLWYSMWFGYSVAHLGLCVVAAGSAFIVPISATVCTPYKYDCRQRQRLQQKQRATLASDSRPLSQFFIYRNFSSYYFLIYFLKQINWLAKPALSSSSFICNCFYVLQMFRKSLCLQKQQSVCLWAKCPRKATDPPPISPTH